MNAGDTQLGFEDLRKAKKLYRSEGPATSKIAAIEIVRKLGERQAVALEYIKGTPGLTQAELDARHTGVDKRAIGRRVNELQKAGRIRRGEKRRCTITGKLAFTWWAL